MENVQGRTIAVMGVGWVGGALARQLESANFRVVRYDPPKGMGTDRELTTADVFFVCVPTPYRVDGGGFDLSFVESAVRAIPGGKVVIVKSTVWPGTTEGLQEKFPQHRFLFNPEFLREATADDDMAHPDRQIVGFTDESESDADMVMSLLPDAPFMKTMPATEAEFVKYFGNCFLAAKVVFANQMFDVCRALGLDYDMISACAAEDPRIGKSHLKVLHDGYRGYGGSCFPKDVRAMIQFAEKNGVDLPLLKIVETINEGLIKERKKCENPT